MTKPTGISVSGKQCRTFGDLRQVLLSDESTSCRFCKRLGCEVPLAKYGVRHYVCGNCIDQRSEVVLPGVVRAERRWEFWARNREITEVA